MLNLLLAEDQNMVFDGIKLLLESTGNITVVDYANSGKEVIDKLNNGLAVDLVLTDVFLPDCDVFSLIKELRSIYPTTSIAILSLLTDEKLLLAAFEAGASGYLLKNMGSSEFVFAVNFIARGDKYLSSGLSMQLLNRIRLQQSGNVSHFKNNFSTREIEVLRLIAEGLTNSEMSEKLFISKRTIEGHRKNLLSKTHAKNTAALIKFAVLNHII